MRLAAPLGELQYSTGGGEREMEKKGFEIGRRKRRKGKDVKG